MGFPPILDLLQNLVFGKSGKPIDPEGELVVVFVQRACPPGGESENGRTAQSLVGEEEGTFFFQAKVGYRDLDCLNGQSRQGLYPGNLHMKGEQGWNGRNQAMAECRNRVRLRSTTSPGPKKPVTFHGGSVGQLKQEAAAINGTDRLNSGLRDDLYPGLSGGICQAVDDSLGGVGCRKHPAIRFGL